MTVMKTMMAGAALAMVMAAPALATPAGAASLHGSRHAMAGGQHFSRAAYRAHAEFAPGQFAQSREQALRQCSEMSRKYSEYTWGDMEIQQQRSCMASHGQPE